MPDSWEMISSFIQVVALPVLGWVLLTMINHSKQIILLEEKVNDTLNRRMTSIEDKVVSLEIKIETKIDSLEASVVDCKLAINDKLNEKFNTLIAKLDDR
jgi:hypothetical protein